MCEGFRELSVLILRESERVREREGDGAAELPLLLCIISLSFNYPALLHGERRVGPELHR